MLINFELPEYVCHMNVVIGAISLISPQFSMEVNHRIKKMLNLSDARTIKYAAKVSQNTDKRIQLYYGLKNYAFN
jgi:hypothetical protein